MLKLPDIQQRSPHTCGAVAYRIVARHFGGIELPPAADPLDGMHPSYLEPAFRRAGYRTQSGHFDVQDLRYHTGRGRPVVCLVTHGDTGHYVVVAGVSRGKVHFQCPATGPGRELVASFVGRWKDLDRHGTPFAGWAVAVWWD